MACSSMLLSSHICGNARQAWQRRRVLPMAVAMAASGYVRARTVCALGWQAKGARASAHTRAACTAPPQPAGMVILPSVSMSLCGAEERGRLGGVWVGAFARQWGRAVGCSAKGLAGRDAIARSEKAGGGGRLT